MDQTPNEKLVGTQSGEAIVETQKRAAGTYSERISKPVLSEGAQPKSTVTPFRGA